MPGLDYLQPVDPRDDNVYRNGIANLAVDFGVLYGGEKLTNYLGNRIDTSKPMTAYQNMVRAGPQSVPHTGWRKYKSASYNAAKAETKELAASKAAWGSMSKNIAKTRNAFTLIGTAVMAYDIARSVLDTKANFVESSRDQQDSMRRANFGQDDAYFDSRAAFTQRQRAIQAIHNSQMSTRAILGDEARWLHS